MLRRRGLLALTRDRAAVRLEGANLSHADLSGACLTCARLSDAQLTDARLEEANLDGADLGKARLMSAHLQGAHMHGVNLEGAELRNARLDDVDLSNEELARAQSQILRLGPLVPLSWVGLAIVMAVAVYQEFFVSNVSLSAPAVVVTLASIANIIAIMIRSRLSVRLAWERWKTFGALGPEELRINLSGTSLIRANLRYVQLASVDLQHANLENADLAKANLKQADLTDANLRGTNLASANLSHSVLDSVAALKNAIVDSQTRLDTVVWRDTLPTRPAGGDDPLDQIIFVRDLGRVFREVSLAMKAQGLYAQASAYRVLEQRTERYALRLESRLLPWAGSAVLDLVSGYGERPARAFQSYVVVVLGFAVVYFELTNNLANYFFTTTRPLKWYEALVLSVSSFHGRGFFPQSISLSDPVAMVAAVEAIIGLFIELVFIATFNQRFFDK